MVLTTPALLLPAPSSLLPLHAVPGELRPTPKRTVILMGLVRASDLGTGHYSTCLEPELI